MIEQAGAQHVISVPVLVDAGAGFGAVSAITACDARRVCSSTSSSADGVGAAAASRAGV